jgi:hypothetical protein
MRDLALVLSLLALPAAWASEADMQSSACRDALAALQAHETAMAVAASPAGLDRAPAATSNATWRALRAKAAHSCLGGAPDAPPPPPRAATWPGIAVPPVTAASPTPQPAPRIAAPPMPAQPPPPAVTLCDGFGCWTHDGERLPQFGRSPFDPRAHCTVQGRIVMCL